MAKKGYTPEQIIKKVTHFRYKLVEWPDDAIELEATMCNSLDLTCHSALRHNMF